MDVIHPISTDTRGREVIARYSAQCVAFARLQLAEPDAVPRQQTRQVNPSLERHAAWISAVGATVALADFDQDGLANDVCHVDPRTDLVTLAPVPDSGERFALFPLTPSGALFDAEVMAPMGCVPVDANEDGRLDILVYYWGRTPLLFLDRDPAPGPPHPGRYVAQPVLPDAERWYTNAATFADLDGDLLPEVYFANDFGPDRLFHNRSRPGAIEMAWVEGRRGFRTPRSPGARR